MRSAIVVIGAGFGDEGKGLVTDALAGPDSLVVRHNGGAQAGHSVQTPDGRRHVFSHVGAGAFAGADSFLSQFFVCHPLMFMRELAALARLRVQPRVLVDPRAAVTTPWDMLVNQAVEQARGQGRHGSCGLGFGETVARSLVAPFRLTVADLAEPRRRRAGLEAIRERWLPTRLGALGLAPVPPDIRQLQFSPLLLADFEAACEAFLARVTVTDAALAEDRPVLFEGAQGLRLDQRRGAFPHVTRSNTGLLNAARLARAAGIGHLTPVYVSRCYVTRHGAGPLEGGTGRPPGPGVVDPTNQPNPWQGRLRFAPLDLARLSADIAADLGDGGGLALSPRLALTCLDQLPEGVALAGRGERVAPPDLPGLAAAATGLPCPFSAWGPSRVTFSRTAPALAA